VLRTRAATDASALAEAWPIAEQHGPFLSPQVADEVDVVDWRMAGSALITAAAQRAFELPLVKGEEKWRAQHLMVMHAQCPKLGKVPTLFRMCHDAQRCVHEGPGTRSADLWQRVRHAFTLFGNALGKCTTKPTKVWNTALQSSMYVCRFRGSADEAQATSTTIHWHCHNMVPL